MDEGAGLDRREADQFGFNVIWHLDGHEFHLFEAGRHLMSLGFSISETIAYLKSLPRTVRFVEEE